MTLAELIRACVAKLDDYPPGRANQLARTKLDEALLWGSMAFAGVDSPSQATKAQLAATAPYIIRKDDTYYVQAGVFVREKGKAKRFILLEADDIAALIPGAVVEPYCAR